MSTTSAKSPLEVSVSGISRGVAPEASSLEHASSKTWPLLIIAVSIGANAVMLIAQQVAIRLLAPLIGSSVETWSTIIGVFLLGIALGNRIAGKLADRYSPIYVIAGGLFLGSISLFLMPVLVDLLASIGAFSSQRLGVQILSASLVVCLLPGIALSLVTPPSIRSLVTTADEAGSVSGKVFAWGTFGSLLGNYIAGFVLLATLGVRVIVSLGGWFLVALAITTLIAGRHLKWNQDDKQSNLASDSKSSNKSLNGSGAHATTSGRWMFQAIATVTACSFVSGALEGAAFRILGPAVGVSMFLTAGVVGVVLAGMSIGNAWGGKLASRHGSKAVLKKSLFAASLATLAVAPLYMSLSNSQFLDQFPLIPKILILSFTLFFLPSIALGTITPQVIRLSVSDVRHTGAITGRLYAWSTLGCIVGILASAWFMVEAFGALRTSVICGLIPILFMWMISGFEAKKSRETTIRVGLVLIVGVVLLIKFASPHHRESKYFAISVTEGKVQERDVKKLALDALVHSIIDPKDPNFLFYNHEYIQGEFTRTVAREARAQGRVPRILIIGGGGYTFPRWVEAQDDLSDVEIDVVEIDPAVTDVSHELLGFSRQTRVRSFNVDGRQYVKTAPRNHYDLVIQDAVNDLSVPYHLMTVQYNGLIRDLLTPEGMYLLTVIDSFEHGRFLPSAIRTVEAAFGESKLLIPKANVDEERAVYVIATEPKRLQNVNKTDAASSDTDWWSQQTEGHIFDNEKVRELINRNGERSPILTDDFAPVDILMSDVFLKRK